MLETSSLKKTKPQKILKKAVAEAQMQELMRVVVVMQETLMPEQMRLHQVIQEQTITLQEVTIR